MNSSQNLVVRIRNTCDKLRRTPIPIADIIPLLQEAVDAIELERAHQGVLKHKIKKLQTDAEKWAYWKPWIERRVGDLNNYQERPEEDQV